VDQKQPSYGVGHMHSGDYEGPIVEREMERIKQFFLTHNDGENESGSDEKKKGFFGRLFG
jgi:hypothetical protein